MYQVLVSDCARRFYEAADAPLQRRLDRVFRQLAAEPRRHANIRRLSGELSGLWRYRLGDYRIIYQIADGKLVVTVITIAHRREVYE